MCKNNRKKSLHRSADGRIGKHVPLPALKRRWAVYSAVIGPAVIRSAVIGPAVIRSAVIGLAVLGAVAILNVGVLMGEPAAQVLPDFSVDTADGKYNFSEQRGKILIYFFSFPG